MLILDQLNQCATVDCSSEALRHVVDAGELLSVEINSVGVRR